MIISVFFIEIFTDTHSSENLPLIVYHQSERNHSEPVNPFCLEHHGEDLLNLFPSVESVKLHTINRKFSIWNPGKVNSYSGSIFHPPRLS